MPASGGGFRVEPAAIRSGAGPLNEAASGLQAVGLTDSSAAHAGAAAAGTGPLADELGELGARLSMDSGQLSVSLSETATVLEMIAAAYIRADRPLAGAP